MFFQMHFLAYMASIKMEYNVHIALHIIIFHNTIYCGPIPMSINICLCLLYKLLYFYSGHSKYKNIYVKYSRHITKSGHSIFHVTIFYK